MTVGNMTTNQTMTDLTLTRSGELDITHVEGNTPAGIGFVDSWGTIDEMMVYDAGVIFLRTTDALEADATAAGLTIERDLVASEKPGGGR